MTSPSDAGARSGPATTPDPTGPPWWERGSSGVRSGWPCGPGGGTSPASTTIRPGPSRPRRRGRSTPWVSIPRRLSTFIATPLNAVTGAVAAVFGQRGLRADAVVTDVAGVKGPVVAAVGEPRFVGGHPMAGSEQVGLDGADPELFVGATWVLTPTAATDPVAYARLQAVVVSLGAEVVALSPEQHDALVAVVSHVPHLTAATLMNLADRRAEKHAALLRLAAGGFRDMTRIAAGQPGIWPDVCADNARAIVDAFDLLLTDLTDHARPGGGGDRAGLLAVLDHAAVARRSLPSRAVRPERLTEIRVPVPDRPGVLAEITTLAGDLGVNISDLEIAHSAEGERGVLVLVVDADGCRASAAALAGRAYRSTARTLE